MPTQSTTYNTRLTDEALEKRFRDTFRSQGGAELVDDLYASGVIVPVVDFTAAAEGSALRQDLQTAWDFATSSTFVTNTTANIITTTGFWRVNVRAVTDSDSNPVVQSATLQLTDGLGNRVVWSMPNKLGGQSDNVAVTAVDLVVFCNTGISLTCTANNNCGVGLSWRQIADISGNLTNPSGFSLS